MGYMINLELINSLPGFEEDLVKVLKIAKRRAKISRIAFVGGIIRDQLIKNFHNLPSSKYKDIDLIVEGSANKLGEEIQSIIGTEKVAISKTNKILNTVQLKIGEINIDIASARIETYEYPGGNPKIIQSSIEEDLKRRDFSINAIALDISQNSLIDPFNGIDDIKLRTLKFLHPNSVKDDPSRVIRAARYASRLNFNLDKESIKQIELALNLWPWELQKIEQMNIRLPGFSTRIKMELDILFTNEPWYLALKRLQEWKALPLLDQKIQNDAKLTRNLRWAFRIGINPLIILVGAAKVPLSLASRLQLQDKEKCLLSQAMAIKDFMISINALTKNNSWLPSQWCLKIEAQNWDPQAVAIAICLGIPCWKYLFRWWSKWRFIKSKITGQDLINEGWDPGPQIGDEIKKLRMIELQKLDKI